MALRIVRNDITNMGTEAIVNTANKYPIVGHGIDCAIYKAAGYDELLAYRKKYIGTISEGNAFLTPGFCLKNPYIIHVVSPVTPNMLGNKEKKIRSCYRNALKVALEHKISSIAFPLIATGNAGFSKEEGFRIAVEEINFFLLSHDMDICLLVFGEKSLALGRRIDPDLEEYIDRNYVQEKKEEEYSNYICEECSASISSEIPQANYHMDPDFSFSSNKKKALFSPNKKKTSFNLDHESALTKRMNHLSDTFSQYLIYLINSKGMKYSDVYKRALVDKKTFSKIKNNPNAHPKKITAMCLCMGAQLNMDQTVDLLARAGYALSPCEKVDVIFSYFIENQIYDMIELDIQLEEHGLPCLIS